MMKAVLLESPGVAVLREIPVPEPGAGEILIRTKAGTVCTSDILDMKYSIFTDNLPMVMGHEAAGIVEAVGEGVTDIKVGDDVAVHPVMPCYKCASCVRGLSHLCEDMGHLCFNKPGVFAEYFVTRPDCVRIKPAEMSFPTASLMEPVCVCLEAINRGNVKKGDRVLIAGDGPFGIMVSKLCMSKEPKHIIQTGSLDNRLNLIKGPNVTTINRKNEPDIKKAIMDITEGEGVDCAILCVSSTDAVDLCLEVLRPRGTLVIFAALSGKTPIDLFSVHLKELNIVGSNNDEGYMDDAIRLLGDPELNLKSLITHEMPLTEWQEAFRIADECKESCMKVSMVL